MPIEQGIERFSDAKFKRSESHHSLGLRWRLPAMVIKAVVVNAVPAAARSARELDIETQLPRHFGSKMALSVDAVRYRSK